MKKQSKSMLVLAILTAFVAMAVFLPGMTLSVETAETAPPEEKKKGRKPPAPVAKTGQTTLYEVGDDGDLQMGVDWPDPRFTDNGDGTVTDNLTGLIWLKNANCFGQTTWPQALIDCNGLADGSCGLTDGSSVGDWRLPNLRELQSLIDYGQLDPALPAGHPFDGVQTDQDHYYWSSTTLAENADRAWPVYLYVGVTYYSYKTREFHVWCVRDGQ